MSFARMQLQKDIVGLSAAVSLDAVAAGSLTAQTAPGTLILRRGILIAGLIALETFVRDRTTELLNELSRWPARYEDLPTKLREASLLNALPNLQKYAIMLKRQGDDYETELSTEISKMALTQGPIFGFTKYTSGDFTGNLSDESLRTLLAIFQITDCWNTFRGFSSEIGFGIPSVQEVVRDIVRKRHKSAHSASYSPAISDIIDLPHNLLCIGVCFDASMSASLALALARWRDWVDARRPWRDGVDLYFIDAHVGRFRLQKYGNRRALRVGGTAAEVRAFAPTSPTGKVGIIVERDSSGRPSSWSMV